MDHIQRSLLQDVKQIYTPLILDRQFLYDGLGFWGFPERKSVQVSELWTPSAQSRLTGTEKVSLIQNWLYFSFAHELFGRVIEDTPMPLELKDLISWEDKSEPPRLDSTKLASAIAAWMALEEYSTTETRQSHAKEIKKLTAEVRQVVRAIVLAKKWKEIEYLGDGTEFSDGDLVIISICILGEQIETAMGVIYGDVNKLVLDPPWPMRDEIKWLFIRRSGLCKNEAGAIFETGTDTYSNLVYMYLTSQFVWRKDHSNCSDSICTAVRNRSSPAHVDSTCHCDTIRLSEGDQQLLLQLIKEGSFPMLTVDQASSGLEDVSLTLSKFNRTEDTTLCIAISHVWSDMLGNPQENSMHSCQLVKLQKLVFDVAEEYSVLWQTKPETIGFWIDTICVPRDTDVKQLALNSMRDIYSNASGVLVLDSQIQNTSVNLPWGICLWQIYTSPWRRRLWTLQEGVLNSNTFFAFSDNFWTLEHLIDEFDNKPHYHSVTVSAYREFLQKHRDPATLNMATVVSNAGKANSMDPTYRILRSYLKATRQIMRIKEPEQRLPLLLQELIWRSTSFPDDETICLAILIDFDIPRLMEVPLEARLSTLVRAIGHCPSNLIFNPMPKMDIPGFRWMPKTFLNQRENLLVSRAQLGKIAPEGLLVKLPSLRQKGRTISLLLPDISSTSHNKIHLTIEGTEYQVICVDDPDGVFNSFFIGENGFDGLILLHHRFDGSVRGQDVGCVAKVRKIEDNVVYVTPVRCCLIRSKETVYQVPERSAVLGIVGPGNGNRPLLTPQSLSDSFIKSEAEFVPPTMFCIG